MLLGLLHRIKHAVQRCTQALGQRLAARTCPTPATVAMGAIADLVRSKPELVVENALLRQQLVIPRRSVKRPALIRTDRAFLVLLASRIPAGRQALLLVQPETLPRWHRQGFRLFWKRQSALQQRMPEEALHPGSARGKTGAVLALPVLGGLHHDYRKAG